MKPTYLDVCCLVPFQFALFNIVVYDMAERAASKRADFVRYLYESSSANASFRFWHSCRLFTLDVDNSLSSDSSSVTVSCRSAVSANEVIVLLSSPSTCSAEVKPKFRRLMSVFSLYLLKRCKFCLNLTVWIFTYFYSLQLDFQRLQQNLQA